MVLKLGQKSPELHRFFNNISINWIDTYVSIRISRYNENIGYMGQCPYNRSLVNGD